MVAGRDAPCRSNIALSLLIVGAIGLFLYRIAFAPIAHTSVLVLLIASVGCHLALQGFGLLFFGAEGQRGPPLSNAAFTVDPLRFTGQSIAVYAMTLALIAGLWLFFGFTLSPARRFAPPPSTVWARGWSASGPRCRGRSHSCSPP